jgi:predicted nucleic acid-binding protein
VDTNIWSLALRRSPQHVHASDVERISRFQDLIRDERVKMIGPIRQELLSGIREQPRFERIRKQLRAFPDELLTTQDYEGAAEHSNRCRSRGISGGTTDYLICAVAIARGWQVFTSDADFRVYASVLPLQLFR